MTTRRNVVILLDTRIETDHQLGARLFVEDGERGVCVILYRDSNPVSADRFDQDTVREALRCLRKWIRPWRLSKYSLRELVAQFREEFSTLQRYRKYGYDTEQDFLGRAWNRRMPSIHDFYA